MNIKFTDSAGNEVRITDAAAFDAMVRAGRISADTMLFDETIMAWRRAGGLPEFQAASQAAGQQPGGYSEVPLYGVPTTEAVYSGPDAAPQSPPSVLFGTNVEAPQESSWPSTVGTLALVLGAVLITFITLKFSGSAYNAGYRMGVVAGISIFIAAGAFLLWRFAFAKKKGVALLIFGAGFLLLCIQQSLTSINESKASELATADIGMLIKKAMNGETIDAKDYDPKTYGSAAPLLKIMNEYMTGLQSDSTKLNQEMTQLRLETLLTEQTLRDADNITEGQARLQSMREIMDRYEKLLKQRAEDLPAKVMSSDVDERLKQQFLAGFNNSKNQGLDMLTELFAIERRFASKADELLAFVKARQGQYKFVGENILFSSGRDLAEFNRMTSAISLIAQEETEWQEKAQRQMRRRYEDFQKATKK